MVVSQRGGLDTKNLNGTQIVWLSVPLDNLFSGSTSHYVTVSGSNTAKVFYYSALHKPG